MRPVAARARRQLGQPVERAQQRRLAAARRADQREHLALADRQRDVLDRRLGAVEDAERRRASSARARRAARARGRRDAVGAARRRRVADASAARRRRSRPDRRRRRAAGLRSSVVVDHVPSLVASRPVLRPARGDDVDGEVQGDDDQQQHERRGVGLLRRVALARRRVVVDVARQRRCRCRAARRRPGTSPRARCAASRRAGRRRSRCRRRCGPCPSAAPVEMFGRTAGSRTRRIVAILRLAQRRRTPRARARGIACRPSRVAPKTIGSAISDIIAPAVRNERPKTAPPCGGERQRREDAAAGRAPGRRSRSRCRACPATTSMPDSTARASHAGRPYSTIHTAVATAIGVAITMPMTVSRTVPRIGSRKPPDLRLVEPRLRMRR